MRAVFLEYAWDMGWCDPCAADPLSQEELRRLGFSGSRRVGPAAPPIGCARDPGGPADVFLTRLHVRYRARASRGLVFQETADRANSRDATSCGIRGRVRRRARRAERYPARASGPREREAGKPLLAHRLAHRGRSAEDPVPSARANPTAGRGGRGSSRTRQAILLLALELQLLVGRRPRVVG